MIKDRLVLAPCKGLMPHRRWPKVMLPVGHGRLLLVVLWWRRSSLAIYFGKER